MSIYNNITELIGQTPIVKLNNIVPEGAKGIKSSSLCLKL